MMMTMMMMMMMVMMSVMMMMMMMRSECGNEQEKAYATEAMTACSAVRLWVVRHSTDMDAWHACIRKA
eukprot:8708422-Karenia_brevis.AAC.1